MSGNPQAIPLFADAYLADTMHLSTEEHGAYLLLLMAAWRYEDCSLPNDDKKLARVARLSPHKWAKMADTIRSFWTVEGDRIFNPRLRRERNYVAKKSASNRENSRKRWGAQPPENKGTTPCDRITGGNAPPPPPIDIPNGISSPPSPPRKKTRRTIRKGEGEDTPLSDDWTPTLGPHALRIVDGWPPGMLDREVLGFRSHAEANGRVARNWNAAFGTWIAKAEERRAKHVQRHHHDDDDDELPRDPLARAAVELAAARTPDER